MKIHIIICHYTKLKERKQHIIDEIGKLRGEVTCEFIEAYDKEAITDEVHRRFFIDDPQEWNRRCEYHQKTDISRTLKPSERSIALKHYLAIKKVAESENEYALIIEDDCLFCRDFTEKLKRVIEHLPMDWEIYYPNAYRNYDSDLNFLWEKYKDIAACFIPPLAALLKKRFLGKKQFPSDPPSSTLSPRLMKKNPPAKAGQYSYLIKRSLCRKLIPEIETHGIALPIDWECDWLFHKMNTNIYFNRYKRDRLIITAFFPTQIQDIPIHHRFVKKKSDPIQPVP